MKLHYKPDAILLTIPARFFEEYPGGETEFRNVMDKMNDYEITWSNTIANIPSIEVPWCYLVFLGFVQYRLDILGFEKNATKEFCDGGDVRSFENKNWVNLCGPVITAPRPIAMRGFQGFRYTEQIF